MTKIKNRTYKGLVSIAMAIRSATSVRLGDAPGGRVILHLEGPRASRSESFLSLAELEVLKRMLPNHPSAFLVPPLDAVIEPTDAHTSILPEVESHSDAGSSRNGHGSLVPALSGARQESQMPWLQWLDFHDEASEEPHVFLRINGRWFSALESLWDTCNEIWADEHDTILAQPSPEERAKCVDGLVRDHSEHAALNVTLLHELLQGLADSGGDYAQFRAPAPPTLDEVWATLQDLPRSRWTDVLRRAQASFYAAHYPDLRSLVLSLAAVGLERSAPESA